MYINGPGRANEVKAGTANRRRGSASSGFEPVSGRSESTASAVSGGLPIQGVEAILALQSVEDPTAERRRAARQGHAMLDLLEELRIDLMSGEISDRKLDRLAALVADRRDSGDPRLDSVIAEIDLRVQVELAKRNRFPTRP